MTLLGLAGYGKSGKSTGADVLVADHGWALREIVDPIIAFMRASRLRLADGRLWADVYDEVGYTTAKDTVPGFRQLMVDVGFGMRQAIGENVWIDKVLRCLDATPTCVPNVRYPNEIDAIRARGGIIVWVDRPGVGPVLGDDGQPQITESSIGPDDCDHVVLNDSTPAHLAAILHAIAQLHANDLAA